MMAKTGKQSQYTSELWVNEQSGVLIEQLDLSDRKEWIYTWNTYSTPKALW